MESERRSHRRYQFQEEVSLESDSQFFSGLSGDISEGGIFISTYREVAIGEEVLVEITLPEGTLRARGVVRWRRVASEGGAPGLGISFTELSDRGLVERFLAHRAPLYCEVDEEG
jgi:uncharacterized protein (TIGR02266 family)